MPAKINKTRVRKSATAVESLVAAPAAPAVFELTNMEIEEVSIVDRPANERKFLLRKKKEEEAAKKAAEEKAAAIAPVVEDGEGIDLVEAQKAADELKVKDAAQKAADDAAAKATSSKATAPAPAPAPAPTEVATKAEITDPAAALNELVTASKADITVSTPSGDVTLTVEDAPAATPAAPQALIDKVKAATLAGIDAIAARVAKFRSDVESETVSSYSDSGRSESLWGHIYYIKGMLEALYDIGGPSWEIEAAGDAAEDVDKAASVNKAHKAINAARVKKFAAVHKCMTYAMKDFSGILKELSQDPEESNDATVDPVVAAGGVSKSAPAPVAAPVAVLAPVVTPVVAPVLPPEVLAQITELTKSVSSLKTTVATQAAEMAKARNTVNGSNALPEGEMVATIVPEHDTVIWPADLAAKPMKRPRF